MLSLPRLERKQNNFANAFLIPIFLVLSCSFGIKRINTLISSRSSLENHTRFQAKMGIVYTRFQTKTAQKPYPMGRQISLYEGVPPPPSPRGGLSINLVYHRIVGSKSYDPSQIQKDLHRVICITGLISQRKFAPQCQFLTIRPLVFSDFQNILTNPIISQI